jgi:hypothetical protein
VFVVLNVSVKKSTWPYARPDNCGIAQFPFYSFTVRGQFSTFSFMCKWCDVVGLDSFGLPSNCWAANSCLHPFREC